MRLTNEEIDSIKDVFYKVFKEGKIYLFGSRIDDNLKGGDIDLFIELPYRLDTQDILDKKIRFKLALYEKIGEQKIDVVISQDKSQTIEKEALQTGVLL